MHEQLNLTIAPTATTTPNRKKTQPRHEPPTFFHRKILTPEKLKILVLSNNDLINSELDFIQRCTNLIKLDISNNQIKAINRKVRLHLLKNLRILYLHNNRIESIGGIEGIFGTELRHLTIRGNELEKLPQIEHLIVNMIPTLWLIGERVVFVEERSEGFLKMGGCVALPRKIAEGWSSEDKKEEWYIQILNLQLKYF